jgi:hypothetical protein
MAQAHRMAPQHQRIHGAQFAGNTDKLFDELIDKYDPRFHLPIFSIRM